MGYVYGVAKLVYLEYLSEQGHEQIVRDEFTRAGEGFVEPDFVDDDDSDDLHMCFNQCMAELPAADRAFIKRYYEESRRKKIDNRNSMVEQLKISKNAVVLRAFHIRQRLRKCINKCLKKRGQ
jgi:uncharacterized protein with von Willebrand factor type A (vWA) domain